MFELFCSNFILESRSAIIGKSDFLTFLLNFHNNIELTPRFYKWVRPFFTTLKARFMMRINQLMFSSTLYPINIKYLELEDVD